MIDPKAEFLELSVGGRDYTIEQSPGALQSARKEGTTGAAVWQSSVRAAEWLAQSDNILFAKGLLDSNSTVLELGSGVAGLVPCVLSQRVGSIVATDQQHLTKLARRNIEDNIIPVRARPPKKGGRKPPSTGRTAENVEILALDWEEDDVQKQLAANSLPKGVDVVLACDLSLIHI